MNDVLNEYEKVVRYCLYSTFDKIYNEYMSSIDLPHIVNVLVRLMTSNWFACSINAFTFLKHIIMNGYYDGTDIIYKYLENSRYLTERISKDELIQSVIQATTLDDMPEENLNRYINDYINTLFIRNGEMTNQYEIAEEHITRNNGIYFIVIIFSFTKLREQYVNKFFSILKEEFGDIAHIIKLYI